MDEADSRPMKIGSLRFSPNAWAKIDYLRRISRANLVLYGISPPSDPLLVTDVVLLKQRCNEASVYLDDHAVEQFVRSQLGAGRRPIEFCRLRIHTCCSPMSTMANSPHEAVERFAGKQGWTVTCTHFANGTHSAVFELSDGYCLSLPVPTAIECNSPFPGSEFSAWKQEYGALVTIAPTAIRTFGRSSPHDPKHTDDGSSDNANGTYRRWRWFPR